MVSVRRTHRVVAAVLAAAAVLVAPGASLAHEEIASSDPESGAILDEPISQVTIDFGEPISDDLEMALLHDLGDSEVEQIPAVATRVSETVGVVEFDELTDTGRYFVRYLVTVPLDGHVLAGAITFDYGDAAGSGTNWYVWLVFGLFAAAALSIGAWYSLRPRATQDA
jgi:methionine-rich copper-binding protein CopC